MKNVKKSLRQIVKKKNLGLASLMLLGAQLSAQTGGIVGVNAATTELKNYVTPVTNLMLAAGTIIGIIGGLILFIKWNNGERDLNKQLMGYVGSLIFLVLIPLVVKSFTGV